MNGRLKIHLKANERIYINGGSFRVDRKVSIELLNDVVFLLESHLMTEAQATTPLHELYLSIQTIMLEPQGATDPRLAFEKLHCEILANADDSRMRDALLEISELVRQRKSYEALKRIKALIEMKPAEQRLECS